MNGLKGFATNSKRLEKSEVLDYIDYFELFQNCLGKLYYHFKTCFHEFFYVAILKL